MTNKTFKAALVASGLAISGNAMAADAVNVAYFLEWATPNQVAKVEKAYEESLGVDVNWTNFGTGVQMTEAMLAGDIDISYSQGMTPFVNAVNAKAPIKMVGIAVAYGAADDCVVRTDSGITKDNASELEGQAVAVPLNTMADFGFRMTMQHLGVDISEIQIVDQEPADAAVSLTDGAVAMACGYGENSISKMKEVGGSMLSPAEKAAAGIVSFDIVSVTEKFLQENPDVVRSFLEVTAESNAEFAADQSKIDVIAKDAGMSVEKTQAQMAGFEFPTVEEQLNGYFNEGGKAVSMLEFMGAMFATEDAPALEDYSVVVDSSLLK